MDDTWNEQCFCVGVLQAVDCAGVVGGGAFLDACGTCAGGTTGIIPNPDGDGDGLLDCMDNCATSFNPGQDDFDGDGIGDACDNCVWVYNPDQADTDVNGQGDACDITTGLEEPGQQSVLAVIPNPARGGLVRLDMDDRHVQRLRMLSATGSLVLDIPWHRFLDVDALAPGLYTIVALDAEGRPLAHARFVNQ